MDLVVISFLQRFYATSNIISENFPLNNLLGEQHCGVAETKLMSSVMGTLDSLYHSILYMLKDYQNKKFF